MQNNRQATRAFGIDNPLAWLASLAVVGWASLALAADVGKPKEAKAGDTVIAAGILTTDGNVNSLVVLTDGEEAPAKYEFGGSFDKQTLKGIFSVSRVQLAYVRDGDTRKLLKIKQETPVATGTVTGSVVFLGLRREGAVMVLVELSELIDRGFAIARVASRIGGADANKASDESGE